MSLKCTGFAQVVNLRRQHHDAETGQNSEPYPSKRVAQTDQRAGGSWSFVARLRLGAMTSQAAISFDNLALGYNQQSAIVDLAAEVAVGSLTAIVGPNGAGKSTLLKGIAGLLTPLEGQMRVSFNRTHEIAYLPQQSDIDRSFPITVRDLVAMGLWHDIGPFGGIGQKHQQSVARAIASVGLTGFESRLIGSLSGGQMQRALFARLLLQDAPLMLLDEPFNSVDEKTIVDLISLVLRWHQTGRTVLVVMHDHETVRAHFPNVLMLARELVAHGPTAEVLTAENQFKALQMCEACVGPPHTCGRA